MIKELNSTNDKKFFSIKGFLVFLLVLGIYLGGPFLIGRFLYNNLSFDAQIASAIGSISSSILLIILLFPMLKKSFKDYFSSSTSFYNSLKIWGIGLGVMLFSNLILNSIIFSGQIANNEELNREFLMNYKIISFFEIVLFGPFIEEILFRFSLRKLVGKNKLFPFISALVFGGLHAINGITSASDLIYLLYTIPYGALGYAFGYLYNESDNIFSSLTMHMLHNFLTYMILILSL